MRAQNHSLTVALCVSLIAHGLGLSAMAWWYIQHNNHPKTPPIDRYLVMANRIYQEEKQSTPPPLPPLPPVAQKPPPPPITKKFEKPKEKLKDDSGEANGTGIANRSTDGDKPMQAEEGYEQADLMKPADHFTDAFLPASAGKSRGNDADQQKSPKLGTYTPENVQPSNSPSRAKDQQVAVVTPVNIPGPNPKTEPVKTASPPAASGTRTPVANVPPAQAPTPKPIDREILGHRATVSDTESVALSSTNGGVFRAGRMVGRKGLHVETKNPSYGDASYNDAEIIGDVPTLFAVPVDADGKVRDVQIVQSSGSQHIDQDRKNAIWQWTLEPAKDKDGHVIDNIWMVAFE